MQNNSPMNIPLLEEKEQITDHTPRNTLHTEPTPIRSFTHIKHLLSKRQSVWEQLPDRDIKFNENSQNFKNNKINTSKYTFWTFIPKNFIEQFSKLANIYFLLVGFLQMISEISASGGVPVIFFPLIIILIVSGVKDLFEDLKRKRSDNQENNREAMILENGIFHKEIWENLKVGNIVKINENEAFPADILLLKTSDAKNICYIETKNLDGETNLKRKTAAKELSYIKNISDLEVVLNVLKIF